jgi:hypothetical protein
MCILLQGGWREVPNLQLVNLMYDLTPIQFISGYLRQSSPSSHVLTSLVVGVVSETWEGQGGCFLCADRLLLSPVPIHF